MSSGSKVVVPVERFCRHQRWRRCEQARLGHRQKADREGNGEGTWARCKAEVNRMERRHDPSQTATTTTNSKVKSSASQCIWSKSVREKKEHPEPDETSGKPCYNWARETDPFEARRFLRMRAGMHPSSSSKRGGLRQARGLQFWISGGYSLRWHKTAE